jgi:hypothetical protein
MSDGKPRFWLNLFTGGTWEAFRSEGMQTCGFTRNWRRICGSIEPGDYFLCYLTGVMRWVGILEVIRGSYEGDGPKWTRPSFPLLFEVHTEVAITPETGVPLAFLEGKVDFFLKPEDRKGYKQFFRRCPNLFKRAEDATFICNLIREAKENPILRPVTSSLLNRPPSFKKTYRAGY